MHNFYQVLTKFKLSGNLTSTSFSFLPTLCQHQTYQMIRQLITPSNTGCLTSLSTKHCSNLRFHIMWHILPNTKLLCLIYEAEFFTFTKHANKSLIKLTPIPVSRMNKVLVYISWITARLWLCMLDTRDMYLPSGLFLLAAGRPPCSKPSSSSLSSDEPSSSSDTVS